MKDAMKAVVLMSLFALMIPFKVKADASFSGNADFSMTPQAPIANYFASSDPLWYGGNNTFQGAGESGSAGNSPGNVNNSGDTTYNEWFDAEAQIKEGYTLSNLTGRGGSSPPAEDLTVAINYSYDYNLTAAVFGQQPGGVDSAEEAVEIDVTELNLQLCPLTEAQASNTDPGPNNAVNAINGFFYVTLPPNSVTEIDANMSIEGTASSQIPEPSTFALLGIGAVGLLAYVARRRKAKA